MNLVSGLSRGLLSLLLLVAMREASGEEINPVLEARVKLHQSAARDTPAMGVQMMRRPVPAPTTPAAKYPQYQLGSKQRHDSAIRDAADPQIRFLLNLPDAVALIKASITIDGQPFQMPRQRRIEQIIKEAATDKADVTEANSEPSSIQSIEPKVVPAVPAGVVERLRHTMKLTGRTSSQDEVGWILCNWIEGPTIMQLNDNFQRFRANQQPEIIVLDRNRDGTISAEEIAMSAQSFQECDLNQDGIVQFTEIAAAAKDPRIIAMNNSTAGLLALLPDQISTAIPYPQWVISKQSSSDYPSATRALFDANGDGAIDSAELRALRDAIPDLNLVISFDTASPEKSRIAVVSAENEFLQCVEQAMIDPSGITMMFNGTPVIFSAGQMQSGEQISIGAVNDGYPLLPRLDPNDDGRLTIRELRSVPTALAGFDKNHDGALTADETQSPIRVCFGLGASVHLELVGIRSLRGKDVSVPSAGPEWFVRMDRNKDLDLTRGEFPGTDEQFKALDLDGDQLISADEAMAFEKNAEKADDESTRSESNPQSTKSDSNSKNATASQEEKQP